MIRYNHAIAVISSTHDNNYVNRFIDYDNYDDSIGNDDWLVDVFDSNFPLFMFKSLFQTIQLYLVLIVINISLHFLY